MDESEAKLLAAMIGAGVAVLGLVGKPLLKGTKYVLVSLRSRIVTTGDLKRDMDAKFHELMQRMEVQEFKLNHIVHETSPNGQTSMKDVLNSIKRDMRVTEAKSRAHSDGTSAPTAEAGVEGELLWTSNSFQQLLGVNERDLLGSGWLSYVTDKDQERVVRMWSRAVKERSRWRMRFHMQSINDKEHCVQVVARPVYDTVTDLFCGWVWRLWECNNTQETSESTPEE